MICLLQLASLLTAFFTANAVAQVASFQGRSVHSAVLGETGNYLAHPKCISFNSYLTARRFPHSRLSRLPRCAARKWVREAGNPNDASLVSERAVALSLKFDRPGRSHFIEQAEKQEQAMKESK